jgi:hypothetical protein
MIVWNTWYRTSQETAGTQNTSGFANVDSAFILSYAIIILNVDQVLAFARIS